MSRPPALPDATELRRRLDARELTAEDLVREYLDRLAERQPRINAATQIFRDTALEAARSPRPGPLSGLPISVKECFALAGERVTLGSARMPPIQCETDAAVVRKLRDAGAIVIARGNNPEMLMNAETDNLVFGRSNNPLDTARVPGGSSGGDGALVGSGSVVFGIGSDILGSIRFPAAFCGVVGFKPASGAVDKAGMYPKIPGFADSWNAAGPITRSVRDARLVYNVIADQPAAEYERLPPNLRLIIPQNFPRKSDSPAIETARDAAETALLNAGLHRETPSFDDIGELFGKMIKLVIPGIIDHLRELLTTADGEPLSVPRELLRQILGRPTVYPGLFTWFLLSPVMRPRGAHAYDKLVARFEAARRDYRNLLGDDGLILLPTLGLLAPKHKVMNRRSLRPGVNGLITAHTLANYLDLPAITVPAWRHVDPATGLPPAAMLIGAPGTEGKLLAAAETMEAALN